MCESILAVDKTVGIYAPRVFVWNYSFQLHEAGVSAQDLKILLRGPKHPYYWETWKRIRDNTVISIRGEKYSIVQGADIRLVPFAKPPEGGDFEE